MRRWWFVPFVVFFLMVFLRARPAGYTSTPTSNSLNTPTGTASMGVTASTEPTQSFMTTPDPQATPTALPVQAAPSALPVEGTMFPGTTAVAELFNATPTPAVGDPPATPTHEPPALAPEIAPPTAPPQPTAAPLNQQVVPTPGSTQLIPVRLQIPAINLDLKPISVGIDRNRVPIVPKHDVGWYNASALPGKGSNVVFWGHVLRWLDSPGIPAPFARMQELKPGSSIELTLADGQRFTYRVTQQVQARPEEVQYILPTGGERVTLVSCIGDNVIYEGVLTKEFRLITIAEPE